MTDGDVASGIHAADERQILLRALGESSEPMTVADAALCLREAGFGLSDSTIARRLRMLDHEGLTIQIGKLGRILTASGERVVSSLEVAARSTELVTRAMTVDSSAALLDLLRARAAVEPLVAREVAGSAGPEQIERLRLLLGEHRQAVDDGSDDLPRGAALEFHRELARGSRNPLFELVLTVSLHPALEQADTALDLVLRSNRAHADSVEHHQEILDAIIDRDPDRVESLMREHLGETVAAVEAMIGSNGTLLLERLLNWST